MPVFDFKLAPTPAGHAYPYSMPRMTAVRIIVKEPATGELTPPLNNADAIDAAVKGLIEDLRGAATERKPLWGKTETAFRPAPSLPRGARNRGQFPLRR